MAHLNVKDRVIEAKIVYFGAGLSGKTTNLEQIKRLGQGGKCGELVSLDTDGDRTLFFDWLPFDVGKVNGCDVKMQLYTVPGQPQYAETRRKVLAGSDVVVLVLDSQSGAIDRNREVMNDLKESLAANGLSLEETGFVLQLNKRDLPTAMPPSDLLDAVGLSGSSYIEAVASSGQGVFETLREATRKALAQVRDAARERTPALRTNGSSGLDGRSLYAALTGDAELPGQAKVTIAPTPTAPASTTTTNGSSTPSASPERVEPSPGKEPMNGKNGAHEANKPHVNGALGSNGSLASPASGSATRARESLRADVAGTYPSSAQLNEIVAGHRALSRRIDMLERSIEQAVQSALRNVEAGVVQKTGEKLGQSLERASVDLRDAVDGSLARQGSEVRTAIDDLGRRVDEARDPRIDELAKSQESLRGSLQALKVQLSALHGSADGRFETLEKGQSGIASRIDETRARLGELDRLAEALHPLAAIEARVATLGDVERRIIELPDGAAFDAMSRRLDGLHATISRLGEVEKKLQALPELETRLRALPEIDRRLGALGEIEKKLGTLSTVDRRLEALERDRVTATTLETRLGTFATVLGSEVDGMLENRFANAREEAKNDRIALSDAIHRLGKLVAEVGHGLGNRIDALTSQVARVEARTSELDVRTDRMAQRLEEIAAKLETTNEAMARTQGALAGLEKRMDVHFTGNAKTLEDGFSTAHSHIRALNVEVTKSGQILHRLADDSQKKGWFR